MRVTTRHTIMRVAVTVIASIILSCSQLYASDTVDTVKTLSGIEIQTSVDRTEILIGDLIQYSLVIIHDSTVQLIPPPLGANLGAFDVKDYKPDRVTHLEDGRIRNENIFVLSTFTTGDYVIPPVPVAFKLSDGSRKVILSEAVPIKVKSLLAEAGDSVDIRPLKAQYEPEPDLTPYYLWGGLLLLVILLLVVFFWYRHKRKGLGSEKVDLRPPWEIAFEKMAFLKQKDYLDTGEFRLYYLELTSIVRWYLGRMYKLNIPDMTTEELLAEIDKGMLPDDVYDELSQFLKHADLVKFAKMMPEQSRPERDYGFVHKVIDFVRKQYQAQQESETDTANSATNASTSKQGNKEGVQ